MTSLQATLLIPVLPVFAELFDASISDVSWLITVTMLTGAIATPLLARLADMYGKRRMMFVCLACIVGGSVLAAAGSALPILIVGRAIIGVGMALIPIAMSVLRDELPPERVGIGLALMSASFGIGSAIGFPLAGAVFASGIWQLAFLVSAVLAVPLAVGLRMSVRPSSDTRGGSFDVLGGALLAGSLFAILAAITNVGAWGVPSLATIGCVVVGVGLLAVWAGWEWQSRHPIIDLRSSTTRPILFANLATGIFGFSIFVNMFVTTQQVQAPIRDGWGLGLSPTEAGLVMLPASLVFLGMAPASAWMIRAWGPRTSMVAGGTVMAAAYGARIVADDALWHAVALSTIVAIGTALVVAGAPWIVLRHAPLDGTAAATGLNVLVRSVGGAFSGAVAAAVLAATAGADLVPDREGFHLMFTIAAVAALAGNAASLAIPGRANAADEKG